MQISHMEAVPLFFADQIISFILRDSFALLRYVNDMTAIFNSLIALIPFLLLLPSEKTGDYFSPCERSVTDRFRGFFALLVILHHMAQRVNAKGLLWIYFDTGFLAVAMFFFYSGFGLMKKGIAQREGYFRKRLPQLLIPYIVTMAVYWVFYSLSGDVKSLSSLLGEHFHNESGISFLWYVFVYLGWVLFLGVCLRFMSKDRQILYCACVFALCFVTFGVLVIPNFFWVYDTVIMIPLSCAWAYDEDRIVSLIHRHYRTVLSVSLVLFLMSFFGHWHPLLRVPAYMISSAAFMIFVNTASMKQRPQGKVLYFLGGISYEIYLLHGIPVTFLRGFIANEALWTLSVLIIAVISAYLMHLLADAFWKKPVRRSL